MTRSRVFSVAFRLLAVLAIAGLVPPGRASGAPPRQDGITARYTFVAPVDHDTSITTNNETSWGAEPRLYVLQNGGSTSFWSVLLRFDLSVIPAGSRVITATAHFYVEATDSTPINLHRVTAAWDEATATWNTLGNQYDAAPTATFAPPGRNRSVQVDITALAQAWYSTAAPNHGILLRAPQPASDHTLKSKESADPTQRPFLEVVVEDARVETAADDFDPNTDYGGSDGGLPWLDPWTEVGETDGPAAGQVRVEVSNKCTAGACLHVPTLGNEAIRRGAERGVNLTGATTAILSFTFRQSGRSGQVDLEVSADGGARWTRLKSYVITTASASHAPQSVSLLPYAAPDTRIRFIGAGSSGDGWLYVDNVRVDAVRQGIGGQVWDDLNRDGAQAITEPGLRGVTVKLHNSTCAAAAGPAFRTTVTGDDGYYAFTPLAAGTYCVRPDPATLPAGYALTTATAAREVPLAASQFHDTADFGYAVETADDRLLVAAYAPCTDATWLQQIAQTYSATVISQNPAICGYTVQVAPASQAALQTAIAADPHARRADPDTWAHSAFTPNDPDYQDPWLVYGPRAIHADAAWDVTRGDPKIIIAVLDSGLNLTHPEFAGRIVPGFDFVNSDSDPTDDQTHGTHVTGIAAAGIHNGIGIAGIAGDARTLPVKVLNAKGSGWWSDVARGITWAVDQGARVLNLSLAGTTYSQALYDAIAYANSKGAVVIAAAGNNGMSAPTYPAAFDHVIAVGASDYDGLRMSFSNYGPNVDVMAPGDSIWSTYPPGGYGYMSGTSMAAPHAAGVAALLLSVNPNLTPAQIKDRLQTTATDMDAAGVDIYTGYGLINAQAALAAVAPAPFITPTTSLAAVLDEDANGNGLVDPGDTLCYLVTVANGGAQPLSDVVIQAPLPLYTSYVISDTELSGIPVRDDASPQSALPLDEGGLNIGTVPAGGSVTVSFDVVVSQPPRGVYALVGQATVQAGTSSQAAGQGLADGQTLQVVTPLAGTLLQAGVDLASAHAGQTLTYTFTTDYLGGNLLSNAVITAPLPAGTSYVAGSANAGGTFGSGGVMWNLGGNAAGVPGTAVLPTIGLDRINGYAFSPAASMSAMRTVTGTERLLLVGAACRSASLTYVRYNGVYLTRVGVSERANARTEIWSLVAPETGTHPLEFSLSQSDYCSVGSASFTGVDQTNPLGAFVSANGAGSTASVAASAAAGELMFDTVAFAGVPALTPGAGQTQQWNAGVGGTIIGAGSTRPGAASVMMSWSASASADWAIGAVPIKPATHASLGDTMAAAPTMVTSGGLITVTQTLTAALGIANVSPSALTITGTNGVLTTLVSGPTPVSATVGITGTAFTWVYRASSPAGAIGQLTFGGRATGAGQTWPWAQSNSVIVHPLLTFRAAVTDPPTASPVSAVGYFRDAGTFPLAPSNLTQTTIQASIGDRAWTDLDGDGVQDGGEPGLPGVQICAAALAGGTGGGCATTDFQGAYRIFGLIHGAYYTVTLNPATAPANHLPTTPDSFVAAATTAGVADADFGLQAIATTLGDILWYDANANGLQDVDEPGLANVTLALYRDDGDGVFEPPPGIGRDTFIATTVSDAAGVYALRALGAGSYFVDVTDDHGILAGLVHTVGPQSAAEPTPPIAVNLGDSYRAADFGYVRPVTGGQAIIGDLVWLDGNRNGARELTEPILSGVQVCASPLVGGTGGGCATTDLNGRYLLPVAAGVYTVAPTAPPLGLTASTRVPLSVTVTAGQQALDADFGYYGSTAALGGTIWQDLPLDDVTDGLFNPATEPGLANVSLNVIRDTNADGIWDSGEPILATFSGPAGDYLFADLLPGAYLTQVSDTLAALRRFAVSTLGPAPRQDFNNQRQPYSVTLTAGQTDTTADFGYRELEVFSQSDPSDPGVIGDLVWYDVKGDGVYTLADGDHAIAGVTVALTQDGAAYTTATTNGYGQYLFSDLALGHTYGVQVTDAFGVLSGLQRSAPGPNPGQDGQNQAQPYTITLGVRRDNRTADFGYFRPVTLGDRVFFDIDADGVEDAGEPGIPDVTLDVYRQGVKVASPTTDAAGQYAFAAPADTYTITLTPAELAAGGTLYRWTPTYTPTLPMTLTAGQVLTATDFGLTIRSGVTVTHRLNTSDPVRPGTPISFTIRVTNTGHTWLTTLPLTDVYSPTFLGYGAAGQFATPDSADHLDDGVLDWPNVLAAGATGGLAAAPHARPADAGSLAPGASAAITVWFTTRADTYESNPAGAANYISVSAARFDPDGAGPLPAGAVATGDQTDPAATAYVRILSPTGLGVTDFRAAADRGRVTLTWQTANEAQLVGFRILRQTADGANQGAAYTVTDAPAPGAYTYILEALQTDGQRVRAAAAPAQVAASAVPARLFLPLVVQTSP